MLINEPNNNNYCDLFALRKESAVRDYSRALCSATPVVRRIRKATGWV